MTTGTPSLLAAAQIRPDPDLALDTHGSRARSAQGPYGPAAVLVRSRPVTRLSSRNSSGVIRPVCGDLAVALKRGDGARRRVAQGAVDGTRRVAEIGKDLLHRPSPSLRPWPWGSGPCRSCADCRLRPIRSHCRRLHVPPEQDMAQQLIGGDPRDRAVLVLLDRRQSPRWSCRSGLPSSAPTSIAARGKLALHGFESCSAPPSPVIGGGRRTACLTPAAA